LFPGLRHAGRSRSQKEDQHSSDIICGAQVTEKWNAIIESSENGTPIIDVTRMISLCALDAIGKGAFDYEFQAIADSEKEVSSNELANCFRNYAHEAFGVPNQAAIFMQEVMGWLPVRVAGLFYDYAPVAELKRIRYVTEVGFRAAQEMIDNKLEEMNDGKSKKDILSLLGTFLVFAFQIPSTNLSLVCQFEPMLLHLTPS